MKSLIAPILILLFALFIKILAAHHVSGVDVYADDKCYQSHYHAGLDHCYKADFIRRSNGYRGSSFKVLYPDHHRRI